MRFSLQNLLKGVFISNMGISAILFLHLCITNHKYEYFLGKIAITSNWANGALAACLIASVILYLQSEEWKSKHRAEMIGLSFIFLPFQWLGVHIAAIEYGLKEEFNYRFNTFRVVRIWSHDEKFNYAASFVRKHEIDISNEDLHTILDTNNSFSSIEQALREYQIKQVSKIILEGGAKDGGLWSWVQTHPYITAAIMVGVVIVIGGVIYVGMQNYQHKVEIEAKTLEIDKQLKELSELLKQPQEVTPLEISGRLDKLEKLMASKEEQLLKHIKGVGDQLNNERDSTTDKFSSWKTQIGEVEKRLKEIEDTANSTKTLLQEEGFVFEKTNVNPPVVGPVRINEQNLSFLNKLGLRTSALEKKVGNLPIKMPQGEPNSLSAAVRHCLERIKTLGEQGKELNTRVTNEHKLLESNTISILERILKYLVFDDSLPTEGGGVPLGGNNNNVPSELAGKTRVDREKLRQELQYALGLLAKWWSQTRNSSTPTKQEDE
jgi:hypothetical protein